MQERETVQSTVSVDFLNVVSDIVERTIHRSGDLRRKRPKRELIQQIKQELTEAARSYFGTARSPSERADPRTEQVRRRDAAIAAAVLGAAGSQVGGDMPSADATQLRAGADVDKATQTVDPSAGTCEVTETTTQGEKILPSPEEIKALFDDLPRNTKDRRDVVVQLVNEVAKQGAACLHSSASSSQPKKMELLVEALFTPLPEGYTARIHELATTSQVFRNHLVSYLLNGLDAYLATEEPRENQRIKDPVKRRQDLIRQKQALAEEVSSTFERLGLTLCCPSGQLASLRVLADANNPKGQYRLIPQGTGQAEKVRANLRDLLPFVRFQGTGTHLDEPRARSEGSPSSSPTSPSR